MLNVIMVSITVYSVTLLERSKLIGDLVLNFFGVLRELLDFVVAFALFFMIFTLAERILFEDLMSDIAKSNYLNKNKYWMSFLQLLSITNNTIHFEFYTKPFG